VLQFIRRVKGNLESSALRQRPPDIGSRCPRLWLERADQAVPPIKVSETFRVLPRLEAIAVYEGEIPCTNDDLIRNHAYCWSRMTAKEISAKTGIEQRGYTELDLEHMALLAARKALAKSEESRRRSVRCCFAPAPARGSSLDCYLAFGRTWPFADPHFVRHCGCLRRDALWLGRSYPPPARD